jgi:hypothetical protein
VELLLMRGTGSTPTHLLIDRILRYCSKATWIRRRARCGCSKQLSDSCSRCTSQIASATEEIARKSSTSSGERDDLHIDQPQHHHEPSAQASGATAAAQQP